MNTPAHSAHSLHAAPSPLDRLGGAAALARIVDAFYRQMDTRPDAAGIRAMHGADLGPVKTVLVTYLCEWLGGPRHYSAQRGHPRLRMRHRAFAIGMAERDAWLACMRAALDECGVEPALRDELMQALFKLADWLRNTGR